MTDFICDATEIKIANAGDCEINSPILPCCENSQAR